MSQTIMIGASDPNISYLLQRFAEESGHASTVCQSIEVPGLALTLQPVLIILDIELVEMDNWELVRRLKAEPATSNIPVVIYSWLDEPPENWHAGVAAYLRKSVTFDDFLAVLKLTGSVSSPNEVQPNQTPPSPLGESAGDDVQGGSQ